MILGFAGKAASGKTTAAKHLATVLDGEVIILPMALVLREEVENFLKACQADEHIPLVYGCQEDKVKIFHIDRDKALKACPKWGHFITEHQEIQNPSNQTAVTVRRILQWWGTEYRRDQDPEYWTKAWARKVESYDLTRVHILVDDIRFMNELEILKAEGGLIVRIIRPGFDGAGNHASETSLDGYTEWDGSILNDGSLLQFFEKVEATIESLG